MTKQQEPPERLESYMIERGLVGHDGKAVVAERTASSIRSVERWLQFGIPKPKYAMLMISGK